MKISGLPLWARNWQVEQKRKIQHCRFRLWQLWSGSYGFIGILYSIRLILLYSDHLEGRQTIEDHLVHTGTSLYRCTHMMTSSISILVHFFMVLIFVEAGLSTKIMKICTQHKFPTICYIWYYKWGLRPQWNYQALSLTTLTSCHLHTSHLLHYAMPPMLHHASYTTSHLLYYVILCCVTPPMLRDDYHALVCLLGFWHIVLFKFMCGKFLNHLYFRSDILQLQ